MKLGQKPRSTLLRLSSAMTLMEVVISLAISGMAVGGVVTGYLYCTTSAEKAAMSLAASARAMERVEETRSARWNVSTWPHLDEVVSTNFPSKVVVLDISGSGNAVTTATVLTDISQVSTTPPLKRIRVDCIWAFKGDQWVTNTIETFRAPDE